MKTCPHCGQDLPQPASDATLILDVNRSDPRTGLETWIDADNKVRKRVDGLWDAAAIIWGEPRTDRERGRRNRQIKELRDGGVSPDELAVAFQTAALRWGGLKPGLNGIIVNLGDLIEGVTVSADEVRRYQHDQDRELRRSSLLRAVE